jgi:hypothetical protein
MSLLIPVTNHPNHARWDQDTPLTLKVRKWSIKRSSVYLVDRDIALRWITRGVRTLAKLTGNAGA